MLKNITFLFLLFSGYLLSAQTYIINFSGSNASTTVDSVKVKNLNQGTSLNMSGSDVLVLDVLVGKPEIPPAN